MNTKKKKQKTKNDAIELDDLEGEEEILIKWKNYDLKPSLRCGEMKNKIAKSRRKQGMQ